VVGVTELLVPATAIPIQFKSLKFAGALTAGQVVHPTEPLVWWVDEACTV
jgi:hypothetical protein